MSVAAQHGDPFSVELLTRSGQLVGAMLATLVNFYTPSLIIPRSAVDGHMSQIGSVSCLVSGLSYC